MKNYAERASIIQQRISKLNPENFRGDLYGSTALLEKKRTLVSWMREAGLEARIDSLGNVHGKLQAAVSGGRTFVIGSRLDTGAEARYDNAIFGVMAGIDLLQQLSFRQQTLPFHFELIAFDGALGRRFNRAHLASELIAVNFRNTLLDLKDSGGIPLSDALWPDGDAAAGLSEEAMSPEELAGYFEMEIEQGHTLTNVGIPLGIVNTIYGQKSIAITFKGEGAHAGSTPMENRRDALATASKFILSVEKYARKAKGNLLATVGSLRIHEAASHMIPGLISCSVDIRSDDAGLLSDAYENIHADCERICGKRNIYFEWKLMQETDPADCSKKLRKLLTASFAAKNTAFAPMESGAVYDAAILGKITPACLMLLQSCRNGHDLTERQPGEEKVFATALEVADDFIQRLISNPEKPPKKKEK